MSNFANKRGDVVVEVGEVQDAKAVVKEAGQVGKSTKGAGNRARLPKKCTAKGGDGPIGTLAKGRKKCFSKESK